MGNATVIKLPSVDEGSNLPSVGEVSENPYTHMNIFFNEMLKKYEFAKEDGFASIEYYKNYGSVLKEALNRYISMHDGDRDELKILFKELKQKTEDMQNQIKVLMNFVKNGTVVIPEVIYDFHEFLKDIIERITGVSKWLSPEKAGMGLSNAQKFEHSINNLKKHFPGALQYPDVQKRVDSLLDLQAKMIEKENQCRDYLDEIINLRREYGAIQHRKHGYKNFRDCLRKKKADLLFHYNSFERLSISFTKNRKKNSRHWDELQENCFEDNDVLFEDTLARIIMQAGLEDIYYLLYGNMINGKKIAEILLNGKLETAPRESDPVQILLKRIKITANYNNKKRGFIRKQHVNFNDRHLVQELTIFRQLAKYMVNLALVRNSIKSIFKDSFDLMMGICKQYTTELRIPEKVQMRLLRSMLDDPRALNNEQFVAEFRGAMDFDVFIVEEQVVDKIGKTVKVTKYYPKGIEKIYPNKFAGQKTKRLTISQLKSAVQLKEIFLGPHRELWKTNLGIMHEAARGVLYSEMLEQTSKKLWGQWKSKYESIYGSGQTLVNVHSPLNSVKEIFADTLNALNELKRIEILLHVAINKLIDNSIFRYSHRFAYAHQTWKLSGRDLVKEILTKYGLSDFEIHFQNSTSEAIVNFQNDNNLDISGFKTIPNLSKNYQLLLDLTARKVTPGEFRKELEKMPANDMQLMAS